MRANRFDRNSRIGRAIEIIADMGDCAPVDLQRALIDLTGTKVGANALTNQLQKNGYIERRIVVTDLAKWRAGQ